MSDVRIVLLRGINVGGNKRIEMARLRATIETTGARHVRTYIASGNVILRDRRPTDELAREIERAIAEAFGFEVRVLIRSHEELRILALAIPGDWVSDSAMRADAWFLWPEIDSPDILERLPIREGIDEVRYAPGAVLWRVDAKDLGKSWRNRIVGTDLYAAMTIRNVNTVRRLEGLADEAAADD